MNLWRTGGITLFIAGVLVLFVGGTLTGAVIGMPQPVSPLGFLLVLAGITLVLGSSLEDTVEEEAKKKSQTESAEAPQVATVSIEVYVSGIAQKEMRKDKYVQSNLKDYKNGIRKIVESIDQKTLKSSWQGESVNGFNINPQGHTKERIGWRAQRAGNKIVVYIDELTYHEGRGNDGNRYHDNWLEKVKSGEITAKRYVDSGYAPIGDTKLYFK